MHGHLNPLETQRLAADPDPSGPAAEHLLEGCGRCLAAFRHHLAAGEAAARRHTGQAILHETAPSTAMLDGVAERVLAWSLLFDGERRAAPGLAEELLRLPAEERAETIRQTTRYHTLELTRELAERARREVFHDPSHAAALGRLAVEVGDRLEVSGYPPPLAADVRATACAALANAHRVGLDLFEAERAMRSAREFLADGSGNPAPAVELLGLYGSLRLDRNRYDEAEAIFREALSLCRRHLTGVDEGRVSIQLGKVMADSGRPERAVEPLERAIELLADREPRLWLMASHTLVVALVEMGRYAEAEERFATLQSAYRDSGDDFWMDQRRIWLAARLAARPRQAGGDPERAEELFRQARQGFVDREIAYDYTLVSLELAALLLKKGRGEEVRELAAELVPVFASRQIHRHALAALALFQSAAAAEEVTVGLLHRLIHYFERARNNPYLAFSRLS